MCKTKTDIQKNNLFKQSEQQTIFLSAHKQ